MTISRRSLLRISAAGAAASVVAPTSLASLTPLADAAVAPRRKPRFPGDPGHGKLYYGASTKGSVGAWERQLGNRLSVHRTYYQARQGSALVRTARADLAMRRLPHVSMKPPGTWGSVADGNHDGWLHNLSGWLGDLNRPIFFTVHHEPENDARLGGMLARDYVAMQSRIIEIFGRRAPKVTILPVLQGWSYSKYNRNSHPARWYAKDAKVFGVDVYNPFSRSDKKWVTFGEKLDLIKPYAHGKPIVIGEYGCRSDPNRPGRAAWWMFDAFHYARRNNIVSLAYFNSDYHSPEGSWKMDAERQRVFEHRLGSKVIARPRRLA